MSAKNILIVDDDPEHLFMLKTVLADWGYTPHTAQNGEEAVAKTLQQKFALILMDVRMKGLDGLGALQQIKETPSSHTVPVIIMTAYSKVEDAVRAMKNGAYDYLIKPLDLELLRLTLARALEHQSLKEEKAAGLWPAGSNMVGSSPAFKKVLDLIEMVAPSEATVLITGESGVGKEVAAKAIVQKSLRCDKPFVIINCAALAESLLEAELFGHEKGAFTGAVRKRDGRLKSAHGGTVFLDEVGETSPALQAKLLRAIQEGEIQPVGSDETEKIDVRFIAATNRNLTDEVSLGHFREDLYWRLNVVALHVPPLRERLEDLPLLARHFMMFYAAKNHKEVKDISPGALRAICDYHWPGNIREMQNALERAVILMRGEYLTEADLPNLAPLNISVKTTNIPLNLADLEKIAIEKAMESTGGNKSQAAKILGVTRKTLLSKLKK